MESNRTKLSEIFSQISSSLRTGDLGNQIRVGVTTLGSEHGEQNIIDGAILAKKLYPNIDIVLIGSRNLSELETIEVDSVREMYFVMDKLLEEKIIDASVTMNYNFPVGVSTVGRVTTPAMGKEMYVASSAGLTSFEDSAALVKNAVNGIIVAKTNGIKRPVIGILNGDGAVSAQNMLEEIVEKGYDIRIGRSTRFKINSPLLRGNDIIKGSVDVLVCDTFTGNTIVKMLSSFASGGTYEVTGYGYGPAVGEGFEKNICIISASSGSPVIANAIKYAYDCAKGKINRISRREYNKLHRTDYMDIIGKYTKKTGKQAVEIEKKFLCCEDELTEAITGIEKNQVLSALTLLEEKGLKVGVAFGCIGAVIKVSMDEVGDALAVLTEEGFI